ncbi:hypothetical protein IE53DRAFT_359517 [Violaceomyces palustris]|uniref:Uncharacterized protein n=1 Tax=Violaceomyces palustris TaxID=1673888 RepID=A0ACD0P7L5_9BASI|nr:hypothetical protein IE53DRAFT_359517 [Violaceomyces palustris]
MKVAKTTAKDDLGISITSHPYHLTSLWSSSSSSPIRPYFHSPFCLFLAVFIFIFEAEAFVPNQCQLSDKGSSSHPPTIRLLPIQRVTCAMRHRPSTSLRESSSSKTPRLSVQSVGTQIRQRYYESLYLGEFHSPLSSFLDQLSRLTATGHDSRNYQALAGILRPLLTSQANLSSKYRHAIPDLLHQTCGGKVPGGPGMLDEYEAAMIRRALNSGPGTSVRDQVVDNIKSDQGSKHTAKVINAWIKAMENRDTSAPSRCEAGKNKDQSAEVSASVQEKRSPAEEGPKKRKRKPELPKRWSGSDSFFPWDRRSRNQTSEDPLELLNEVHHLEKENDIGPESLNKRLESLSDRACLSIVTGSLSDELTQELDFLCDESSHPAKEGYARSEAKVSLPSFGSSSRPGKSESDERDEMQWLLSDVIEPFFSQSLPRQCSALRSKCYVPGSGATPSRPTLGPSTSKQPERDELAKTETDLAAKGAASRARARDRAQNRPRLKDALQLEEENKSVRGLSASNRKDLAKNREVSMNRKFSRSISACYGMRQGSQPPVEPLPTAEERGEESQSMGTVERKAFATGRLGKRKGEAQRRVDGLSSRFSSLPSKHQETESDGKGHGKPPTTLVLSTPQKSVRNSTLSGYRKASVPVFPPLGPSHDSFSIALEKFDGRSNTLSKDGTQELQVTSHKPSSTTTSSTLFKSSAFRRAESQPSIPLRLDQNQNLLASSTSGKHGGSPPMRQPGSADRDDVKKDEMDGESDVDLGLQDEEEEDNHKHGETRFKMRFR